MLLTLRPAVRCVSALALALALVAVPAVHAQDGAPPPREGLRLDALTDTTYAAQARPTPDPVALPPAFVRAMERGTRTASGAPGPTYWTNTARYAIDASLDPATRRLDGHVEIRYHNASPDTLAYLLLHLRQNIHAEGAMRNRTAPVTGGMEVSDVTAGGEALEEVDTFRRTGGGYVLLDTRMAVRPPANVLPGDTVTVAMDFGFTVPENSFRMGTDGEVFYLAYWYPQMAVYDDVEGWVAEPYLGNGEFYMGYADYDLRLTVPGGWLVASTGTLENPEAVLSPTVRERLAEAAATKETVAVVSADERAIEGGQPTAEGDSLTWHVRAENVRDVAWGTSDRYVWDATSASTGEGTSAIHALYRPGTSAWEDAAEYAQFSIEHLSEMILPYPYPHMTAVEGLIGGGMEFPMMTLIGGNRTARTLFGVTYHEISHMWLPMVVGQNEKAFAWMDEGATTFNTTEGANDFYGEDGWNPARQYYYRFAGTGVEVPSMRHADRYPLGDVSRGLASYGKPGLMLHTLRSMLGDDLFFEAYRTYARRWAYKHPQPYDLFHTFEDVAGMELDWFWRPAFFETWTLDQAVASVETEGGEAVVTVEDRARFPMPAPVVVTFEDGTTAAATVPVRRWLDGHRTATVRVPLEGRTVARVAIDPSMGLPDVDRTNNAWAAEDAAMGSEGTGTSEGER